VDGKAQHGSVAQTMNYTAFYAKNFCQCIHVVRQDNCVVKPSLSNEICQGSARQDGAPTTCEVEGLLDAR
jgi:hypothetical protein